MGDFIIQHIQSEEKLIGVERVHSLGRALNPHNILMDIEPNTVSYTDGPSRGNKISDDSGCIDDGYCVSSLSTSSSSSDSDRCQQDIFVERTQYPDVKEHRNFELKIENVALLTITAVRMKIKSKYVMSYIVSSIHDECRSENKIRICDKILSINGNRLKERGFDIESLLTFDEAEDGVHTIELGLKRWEPVESDTTKYQIKTSHVELKISKNCILPSSYDSLPSFQKRLVRDIKFSDRERRVVLRMDEYTGKFVFLSEDGDLAIGPIRKERKKSYYHFSIRSFNCLIKDPHDNWKQQTGVVISYHNRRIHLDICSNLAENDHDVVTKVHTPYDSSRPDERFFLKHKDESRDGQTYESLLFSDMCFKFDKNSKNFIMGRFDDFTKSVENYTFQTFSVSIVEETVTNSTNVHENDEDILKSIDPSVFIETSKCKAKRKDSEIKEKYSNHRRLLAFKGLFCCVSPQSVRSRRKDEDIDQDRVLQYFKIYKDS